MCCKQCECSVLTNTKGGLLGNLGKAANNAAEEASGETSFVGLDPLPNKSRFASYCPLDWLLIASL